MKIEPWYILNSKYNCEFKYNLDPAGKPDIRRKITDEELQRQRKKYTKLISVTKYFMKKLLLFLKDTPTVVIITDDEANLLEIFGDSGLLGKLHFLQPGIYFDESFIGTNPISLCLKHRQPVQLVGDQHYFHILRDYSCATSMFTANNLKGTISLLTTVDHSTKFHLGLISSAVDSIERELLLEKSNRKLKMLYSIIIDVTKDGIIITDANGNIIKFNKTAEHTTGFSYHQIEKKHISLLPEFYPFINKVLQDEKKFEEVEITYFIDEDNEKRLEFDAFPMYDEKYNLTGAYLQFKDITEKRQLERKVLEAEKLSVIGKLSAGLAHEIRNPLTPILGFIQLLEETHKDDEIALQYYQIIKDEIGRMKALINDFVLMSKPEVPQKQEVNIYQLALETVELMKSQSIIYNIELKLINELHDNTITLYIDKNQIKQTLINLIQNAIQVMDNGEIKVVLEQQRNGIDISIEDQGKGISEDVIDSIFDPFFTTKEDGIGLGLAVCSSIIKNHYGTISVQSKEGVGTTFTIFLPFYNDRPEIETEKLSSIST